MGTLPSVPRKIRWRCAPVNGGSAVENPAMALVDPTARFEARFVVGAYDRIVLRIGAEVLTIAEWLVVIGALTYVGERYGSAGAGLLAKVLLVGLVMRLQSISSIVVRGLTGQRMTWLTITVASALGALSMLGTNVIVRDLVASNYPIEAGPESSITQPEPSPPAAPAPAETPAPPASDSSAPTPAAAPAPAASGSPAPSAPPSAGPSRSSTPGAPPPG